jgi:hypothetical protein
MRKLANSKIVTEINVTELLDDLRVGKRLIIFYLASNDKYPMFFKKLGEAYGFESTFFSTMSSVQQAYINSSMRDSLEKACKERNVYILDAEEYPNIFNIENFIK